MKNDIRFITEEVSIDAIWRNPANPRIIKDQRFKSLVQSVTKFPAMLWLRPVVVNGEGMILGGDKRYLAVKEAGYKKLPVINASKLTEAQQREFIIKDNVQSGEWDFEALANDWDTDELKDWGLLDFDLGTGSKPEIDNAASFADEGIESKDQYGVIVMCETEHAQESVYKELTGKGYKCKIVVT